MLEALQKEGLPYRERVREMARDSIRERLADSERRILRQTAVAPLPAPRGKGQAGLEVGSYTCISNVLSFFERPSFLQDFLKYIGAHRQDLHDCTLSRGTKGSVKGELTDESSTLFLHSIG